MAKKSSHRKTTSAVASLVCHLKGHVWIPARQPYSLPGHYKFSCHNCQDYCYVKLNEGQPKTIFGQQKGKVVEGDVEDGYTKYIYDNIAKGFIIGDPINFSRPTKRSRKKP